MLTGIRPRVRGRAKAPREDASAVDDERVIPKALVCGAVLRALREQAGIGLEDFARLANVNRPSISKLEAGRTMLAVHHLDLYAEVIGARGRGQGGPLSGLRALAIMEECRDALRTSGTAQTTSGEGAQSQSQRDRAAGRDWDKQQEARREQQEQADRDQRRQQASQRDWQTLFNGTQK